MSRAKVVHLFTRDAADDRVVKDTTIDLIRAALKSDESLAARDRTLLLARLRRGSQPTDTEPLEERIVRRREAARRLGISLRSLDSLGAVGMLPRRRLPGRKRAVGYLESDLLALVTGKHEAAR